MVFGNRSLGMHLARGGVGFLALATTLSNQAPTWTALILLPIALLALKGCPVCWTMGLIETLALKVHGRVDRSASSQILP